MRKLLWTEDCKTGFVEIDSQHRLLFAIANELLDIENAVKQQDEIKYLLHHLVNYTESHFKTEEELFTLNNYPGLKEHKQKHEAILNEISSTIKNAKTMSSLKESLDTMLDKWIRVHVLIEDKKYSSWYNSKSK